MRILIVLTYYRPHVSGLTIYAERLARALAERGHEVTVLTSHYEKDLPYDEMRDGVHVVRVPVMLRISKGVIMPTFPFVATRLFKEHDVVQIHLPQFAEAAWVSLLGRVFRRPTIVTYHCDLIMPLGILSWLANQGILLMNYITALLTHKIVTYTQDYAENSSFLRRFINKVRVILPPVVLPVVTEDEKNAFAVRYNPRNVHPVIGMAARFATEKGVEVLLDALPEIIAAEPQTLVQFAGPWENIVGEEEYLKRLLPRIREFEKTGHWEFVGNLSPRQMSAFYPNIDVLTIPSLNSTEAFGLVQIEAMINGKPSVASNLPGVRQPVRLHKMGRVVAIGDSNELAQAILDTLKDKAVDAEYIEKIVQQYQPDSIAAEYEKLFNQMKKDLNPL